MKRKIGLICCTLLIALHAPKSLHAQDASGPTLWDYLKTHGSVVSGVASANGERSEFVSLALDDSFEIKPRWTGLLSLSLFGRQRVQGESVIEPQVPTSLDALALYSAGEAWGGVLFEATPTVGLECRAGIAFSMTGLTGKIGEPVDSSKITAACGPCFTGKVGRACTLFGHVGPVDEGEHLWGFLPSTVVDGSFRLTDTASFLVYVAAGRDLVTQKSVTSARFSVRKGFK